MDRRDQDSKPSRLCKVIIVSKNEKNSKMFSDYFLGTKHSYDFRTDKKMQKNICRHIHPASHRLAAKTVTIRKATFTKQNAGSTGQTLKPILYPLSISSQSPLPSRSLRAEKSKATRKIKYKR